MLRVDLNLTLHVVGQGKKFYYAQILPLSIYVKRHFVTYVTLFIY